MHQEIVTLMFEDPFWVFIIEKHSEGAYSVARIVVGSSEPTDGELLALIDQIDSNSLRFTKPIREEKTPANAKINFKRKLREAKKSQIPEDGRNGYTKSQALIKQQQTDIKIERKHNRKAEKEREKEHKFILKQQKRKEKHKGH